MQPSLTSYTSQGMGAGPFADPAPTLWRPAEGAISVPTDIGVVAEYCAGKVSGMFRARMYPFMGGTVTVWPLVGVLIGNANAALEPVVR
jgi:hypothetical protein